MDCETLHCVQGDVVADVILSPDAIGTKNLDDYASGYSHALWPETEQLLQNSYYTLQ